MSLKPNTKTFKLNTGDTIPGIGLGTWQATGKGVAYEAVAAAIANGYRHIDAAAIYGNEEEVGKAIADSGLPRKDLFITTKLWNTRHKEVEKALDESLKRLGLNYVDLYLIHWPSPTDGSKGPTSSEFLKDWTYVDTYKELQKVYKKTNKIRAIGVSNFTIPKLEKLLSDKDVDVVPAVNQVELHPLLPQYKLIEFLKKHNILPEAYSPLGSTDSPLFKNGDVEEIAQKHNVTVAQVLVSWLLQRDIVVLPKSVHQERIKSNHLVIDLPQDDFETLNKLHEKYGTQRINAVPEFKAFDDDVQ